MKNTGMFELKDSGASVKKKLFTAYFLLFALSGLIINILLINTIRTHLALAGLDSEIIHRVSRQFSMIGSGGTLLSSLLFLMIAMFLAKRFTVPMKKLTSGMIDIANGKWNTRIDIQTNDELGQLARGFNFMSEHIESTMRKLKASEDYTDNIVVSVPSILVVLSNRVNILSTSRAFDRLNEQYPGLTINQFTDPLEDDIRTNIESGVTIKREIEIVPEGSEIRMIFSATVSRIGDKGIKEDEEIASTLLTITNITERRKMKELVLQSRQDWEDTFNKIPDMITIHDKDFNIIMANKTAKETLNMHSMEFMNSSKCYKYYHGSTTPPDGCPSCDCMKTAEPATFEVYEPHLGKFIEIRSLPRLDHNNELIGLIHIVRDISSRKKIEDEHNRLLLDITKAKIEWEMTFDSAMEFMLLIDRELKITRCNKSFCSYIGKSVEEVIGNHCHDYFSCSPSQIEDCETRMAASRDLVRKSELETENGRWLYISHRPIRGESGEYVKSIIIATDVTELKTAQNRIKEHEKELQKKVDDLEKFYDMSIGRELKMKELKKEVKRLKSKIGEHEEINLNK